MQKNILFTSFLFLTFTINTIAQGNDIKWLRKINSNPSNFKTNYTTFIANSVTPVTIGTPFAMYGIGLLQHNTTLQKNGLLCLATFITNGGATFTLKKIFNRTRPFITYPDIVKRSEGGSASFPSGHTSAAFATSTSLILSYPKVGIIIPASVYAISMGYARMYQGVHYPSDVIAGAVVGTASAYINYKLQKWYFKKTKYAKVIKM